MLHLLTPVYKITKVLRRPVEPAQLYPSYILIIKLQLSKSTIKFRKLCIVHLYENFSHRLSTLLFEKRRLSEVYYIF